MEFSVFASMWSKVKIDSRKIKERYWLTQSRLDSKTETETKIECLIETTFEIYKPFLDFFQDWLEDQNEMYFSACDNCLVVLLPIANYGINTEDVPQRFLFRSK